jgi:hypothetical protein
MKKYKLNLFENYTRENYVQEELSNIFNLDIKLVSDFFCTNENQSIDNFVQKMNIDFSLLEPLDLLLTCRHGISSIDNFKSLNKYGLQGLNFVLTEDTPLKMLLDEYGIKINCSEEYILVEDIKIELLDNKQLCSKCVKEIPSCRHIVTKIPTNEGCLFREQLTLLREKIIDDKCEIEVFLYGNNSKLISYSTIRSYPEIIDNIDALLSRYSLGKYGNDFIKSKWVKKYTGFNLLEFDVKRSDLERWHLNKYVETFNDNQEIYYNYYFALDLLFNVKNSDDTIYGQLQPMMSISVNDIKFINFA